MSEDNLIDMYSGLFFNVALCIMPVHCVDRQQLIRIKRPAIRIYIG